MSDEELKALLEGQRAIQAQQRDLSEQIKRLTEVVASVESELTGSIRDLAVKFGEIAKSLSDWHDIVKQAGPPAFKLMRYMLTALVAAIVALAYMVVDYSKIPKVLLPAAMGQEAPAEQK
jgi:septal ring factor EnvC (AmiA/AmiB activator)